jgi:hypothetical protein
MFPTLNCKRTAVTVALVLLVLFPSVASASSIDEVVDLIAKNVLKYMEDQVGKAKKELFIDQFKGPKTGAGRLLETRIRQKLTDGGVEILQDDLEASWTLTGRLATDTTGKSAIVSVRLGLLDSGGNSRVEFNNRFRDDEEVQAALKKSIGDSTLSNDVDAILDRPVDVEKLAATTVDNQTPVLTALTNASAAGATGGKADQATQAKKIRDIPGELQKEAIANPKFFADGTTRVRASENSDFGIEIRVSASPAGPFVPIVVQDKGGRAFVDLQQEQFFQVHVFNNSQTQDVGLQLRMDGINSMHFAEGADAKFHEDGKWLIRAGTQGAAIQGWFINSQQVDRFIIKAEPDGVAANVKTLGRPHPIGTIQAIFFGALQVTEEPSLFAAAFGNTKNAVGRGVPVKFGGTMEKRRFEEGQSLASISVLYRNPSPADLPPIDVNP